MKRHLNVMIAVAIACAASAGHATRLQVQTTDAECGTIQVQVFSDPQSLVKEYLARMSDGQFLSRWENVGGGEFATYTPWLRSAILCPARLPALDVSVAPAIIVARYEAGSVRPSGETAMVTVSYDELGRLEGGAFKRELRRESIELQLQRTPWGWRVVRHDDVQRVSAPAAMSRIHLTVATQQQIAAATIAR